MGQLNRMRLNLCGTFSRRSKTLRQRMSAHRSYSNRRSSMSSAV